jgi:hypothetical protein
MTQSTHMMSDGTEDIGREAIAQRMQSFYRARICFLMASLLNQLGVG